MADDKVSGLGGVFFKSENPKALCEWYDKHLGTSFGANSYMMFKWRQHADKEKSATTTFSIFKKESDYFGTPGSAFMLNFRVNNMDACIERMKKEGVQVIGEVQEFDYGKFAWIVDADGNRIELWEPKNEDSFDEQG